MANLNLNAPNGWNQWIYVKNVINNVQLPDASLPYKYVPSGGFWLKSIISHCLIPWINVYDIFSLFLLGGGTTGTLIGSLGGLTVVGQVFNIATHGQIFGIGRGVVPPIMGYCIGNKFKQHVYTRMDVQNDGLGHTIITNISVDLLQNSRFKRAYLYNGSVVTYSNTTSLTNGMSTEYLLDLGINTSESLPSNFSMLGDKISIVKSANSNGSSTTFTVDILGIKDNWNFIISKPQQDIYPGDYYKFHKIFCLEDPYLLSGFWEGAESSLSSIATSGLDLYKTTHNSPYEEGKFLGVYIWKTDPIPEQITNNYSSNVSSQPISGYSMDDSEGFSWTFFGFGNSKEYGIYPDDKRYRETHLDSPDSSGSIVVYKERLAATNIDYGILSSSNPSYLRVEIGTGGYRSRHNWYAPCLKGQFIESNNKIYKILDHINFNIIDVSFLDIKGESKFDPLINRQYSIVNEYGWFLNEHYDGRISTKNNTGIFKGTVSNVNGNMVSIVVDGDTFISQYKYNGLSFIDRYQKDILISSSLKRCFVKYHGWKLIISGKEYDIDFVDFSSASNQISISYPITVKLMSSFRTLTEVLTTIRKGDRAYISFGKMFDTFGNYLKESGFSFSANVNAALRNPPSNFIISDVLCMDGEFFSDPYKLNIASEDRIGFTEGYLFGLEANGSAASTYSQLILMTVPGAARGVSSFFHELRQEDWAAFQDPVTGKITIRKGSMDFTEYPQKDMIVIGKPSYSHYYSSNSVIVLDTQYDYLRRIQFRLTESGKVSNIGIMFGIGSKTNIYGFYISGDGLVNLQLFKKQGIAAGIIPSNTYQGNGYNVSPIYIYKQNYYQNLDNVVVNIGVKTQDGPICINGDGIQSNILEYAKENQTISNAGYFDIIRTSQGENLMIYGASIGDFSITDTNTTSGTTTTLLNNSNVNDTKWTNQNAIMIIGTYDDSYTWASPMVGRIDDQDDIDQYPLMVLNSVDYLGCIYNSIKETLSLFARCYCKNESYLGLYTTSLTSLIYKNFLCKPTSNISMLKFKWKLPLFDDSFIINQIRSWTDKDNIISDNYSFNSKEGGVIPDRFVRVMGPSITQCQIINNNEFGIISTSILQDGTYIVFYDTELGIQALFSNDNGSNWRSANVIFSKYGRNAILLDGYLFYIGSDGIEFKRTNIMDYYNARNISLMNEGNSKISKEIVLQNTLDAKSHVLIGSGIIESQRLSGYITPEGLIKIFFYDQNNLLKCMESSDTYKWYVANNF